MKLMVALKMAIIILKKNNQIMAANKINQCLQGLGEPKFDIGDKAIYMCKNNYGNVKPIPSKIEDYVDVSLTPLYEISVMDSTLRTFATEDQLLTSNVETVMK